MRMKLKHFRVRAGLTQAKVAAAVGVTQPNYQRWESGSAPVPDAKLKKLARVLKTSPEAILNKHKPIEAALYDDTVSDELSYYGEVAIHFLGGGAPLLLSISEDAFTRLHRDLQGSTSFVTVESLANQTVIIRTKAVSDLYFSSEAHDDFGPEHGTYENHVDLRVPDARDWEIIECLALDEVGIEEYDPADVKRVREMVMITDQQYKQLVADGHIKPEDLDNERKKNQIETDKIFAAAHLTTYQLSTGQLRSVYVDNAEDLFDAFADLVDYEEVSSDINMIRIESEGRHRVIFINKVAIDYVSIPTHKFDEGRVESDATALDE